MQLPGGLLRDNTRRRDFSFRPLTGAVEMALTDLSRASASIPRRVTTLLAAALEQLADGIPTIEAVAELCVADRQFLMTRLAAHLGLTQAWQTSRCESCSAPFDVVIDYRDLPVKEAGQGFPFAEVATQQGVCRFRVPNGADQEVLADIAGEEQALHCLLTRCLVATDNDQQPDPKTFDSEDVAQIESALEAVSPELAVTAQTSCPACARQQDVPINLYGFLTGAWADDLLHEVHLLAFSYHWSEQDILALPRQRRRHYLTLIDQSFGTTPSPGPYL